MNREAAHTLGHREKEESQVPHSQGEVAPLIFTHYRSPNFKIEAPADLIDIIAPVRAPRNAQSTKDEGARESEAASVPAATKPAYDKP